MHPRVSQFLLQPEAGRGVPGPRESSRSSALSRSALGREVIVPVPARGGIRAEVDACLDAIEVAYTSRRVAAHSTMAKSQVKELPIHRIETGIVKDYVEAVYRDYHLRDRFGPLSSNHIHRDSPQLANIRGRKQAYGDVLVNAREERRPQSARAVDTPHSSKKYLNITQESKVSRRQGALSFWRKVECTADSARGSPPRASHSKIVRSTKGDSSFQRVRQDFRFCVNCEKPVLTANSDFHEKYECQGFEKLYSVGLEELAQVMEGKTQNARKLLKQQLDELRQKRNDGRMKAETIFTGSMELMEQLSRNPQSSPRQIEQQFIAAGLLRQAQNNLYSISLEQAQKVAAFQEITASLNRQAEKLRTNMQGSQPMRPIALIRSSFSPPVQVGVLPLHPHLHRYIRRRL